MLVKKKLQQKKNLKKNLSKKDLGTKKEFLSQKTMEKKFYENKNKNKLI